MSRIDKIKALFDELKIDAFYITHNPNIRYLTGFSGSAAYVIISKDKNYFVTDFRYKEQSKAQVKGYEILVNFSAIEETKKVFEAGKFKRVGFESSHLTVHQLDTLKETFPGVEFIPVHERIERITMVKTEDELAKIKKACEITDRTFNKILEIIKPGMKESEVAAEITYWHRKYGAEKDSFDSIVASGWRGALPHGAASDKVIETGEMVTLDFGCVYQGFCSDLTRTISIGTPPDEMKKIYGIVLESQQKAIDGVKEGANTKALDTIARDHIYKSGYEGKFGHGLGHGLGIEVHEIPSVSQRMDMNIPKNVVFTIEPGIYVEGLGGVRIEDDVVVVNGKCEVLNASTKELIII
jgi:Xaa-Pro aminopeptidase